VIATPLTACLAVLGRYVRNLEFFGILLGDEPVLEPQIAYYQRLLAKDPDEAAEIVEEFIGTHSTEEAYDRVLVPALVLAGENRERGEATAEEQHAILDMTRELLEDISTKFEKSPEEPATASDEGGDGRIVVFGCPARDATDELALTMFSQLMDASKYRFKVVSHNKLAAEVISQAQQEQAKAICIACVPPKGLARTRYLCKRLRAQFPDLKILVGCWGLEDNLERTRERLVGAGANKVGFSLVETQKQLLPLVQLQSHIQQQEEKREEKRAGAA
jgi:hypothetical protein